MTDSAPGPREFDLDDVLAITHGFPVYQQPYLAILAFLNGRPASIVDSRRAPAAWILEQHPALREFTRPDMTRNDDGASFSDQQLAVWDAWAADIKAQIGHSLTLTPIPDDRRDHRSMVELVLDRGADPSKVWAIDLDEPDLGIGDPHDPA